MRKFVAAVATLSIITALNVSAVPQENCGCGIGTMIFEGQDGLVSQTLAVTTNGVFANILFGISTGTLECSQPDAIVQLDRARIFVAANMDNLASDIAVGNGEYIHTLAELIEVPKAERSQFYSQLQANFETIYSSDDVSHDEVLDTITKIRNS